MQLNMNYCNIQLVRTGGEIRNVSYITFFFLFTVRKILWFHFVAKTKIKRAHNKSSSSFMFSKIECIYLYATKHSIHPLSLVFSSIGDNFTSEPSVIVQLAIFFAMHFWKMFCMSVTLLSYSSLHTHHIVFIYSDNYRIIINNKKMNNWLIIINEEQNNVVKNIHVESVTEWKKNWYFVRVKV